MMVPYVGVVRLTKANKAKKSAANHHTLRSTSIDLLLPSTRVTTMKLYSSAEMMVAKEHSIVLSLQRVMMVVEVFSAVGSARHSR